MPQNSIRLSLAVAALCALSACKILPTGTSPGGDKPAAFDPDASVADIWDGKVLPYLKTKSGPYAEVQAAAKADPAAAGAKYGNTKKQANSPWTYAATIEGKIVAANTQSRAATIDVDVDGDDKADARVQIGPAIRGTALRDVLDFVDFNSFTNQIDYAQFGKAFNMHVNKTVLGTLPRDALEGRTAKVLGAFAASGGTDLPLATPAEIEIGPKP
jgi:predicted lipoprotein